MIIFSQKGDRPILRTPIDGVSQNQGIGTSLLHALYLTIGKVYNHHENTTSFIAFSAAEETLLNQQFLSFTPCGNEESDDDALRAQREIYLRGMLEYLFLNYNQVPNRYPRPFVAYIHLDNLRSIPPIGMGKLVVVVPQISAVKFQLTETGGVD